MSTITLRNRNKSDYTDFPTTYTFLSDHCTSRYRLNSTLGYQADWDPANLSEGRTGVAVQLSELSHQGEGDAINYFATCGTSFPAHITETPTSWTHGNTGTLFGGQSNALTSRANAVAAELHISDVGNDDATLYGLILSFDRTGAKTEVYSTPCIGVSAHMASTGTRGGDAAFRAPGQWRTGLDFTTTLLGDELAAIALQPGQRIYFGADNSATTSDEWFIGDGNEHGNDYIHLNPVTDAMEIVRDGKPQVSVYSDHVRIADDGVNNISKLRAYGGDSLFAIAFGQFNKNSYLTAVAAANGVGNDTKLHLGASREGAEKQILTLNGADETIEIVKPGTAAATPANFSADGFVEIKVAGVTKYLPYSDTAW